MKRVRNTKAFKTLSFVRWVHEPMDSRCAQARQDVSSVLDKLIKVSIRAAFVVLLCEIRLRTTLNFKQ